MSLVKRHQHFAGMRTCTQHSFAPSNGLPLTPIQASTKNTDTMRRWGVDGLLANAPHSASREIDPPTNLSRCAAAKLNLL